MSTKARSRTRARRITSVALGAIVALSASGQALAATTYTDPVGDARFQAPAYADVVAGSVDLEAGVFEFTVTVAETIPEAPDLPALAADELRWAVPLDLDPTTAPVGWPLAPGADQSTQKSPVEGFMAVAWNGSAFSGTWYDRRPLLSGGEVTATSVPFQIDGATVHIWIDGALIGDPTSFRFGAATAAVQVPFTGRQPIDVKQVIDLLPQFLNQWP